MQSWVCYFHVIDLEFPFSINNSWIIIKDFYVCHFQLQVSSSQLECSQYFMRPKLLSLEDCLEGSRWYLQYLLSENFSSSSSLPPMAHNLTVVSISRCCHKLFSLYQCFTSLEVYWVYGAGSWGLNGLMTRYHFRWEDCESSKAKLLCKFNHH